ncbi:MAG: hypothetical protein DRH97_04780, partial [Chloroflexi bacterium]
MNAATGQEVRAFQLSSPIPDIRLDKYLTRVFPQLSRAYVQRLIEQGCVLVNGERAKASRKLDRTDRIAVELPPLP